MNKLKIPGRKPTQHRVLYLPDLMVCEGKAWDDELEINTQCSSQWDSLCHFQHQPSGLAYNGVKPDREALDAESTATNTMPTLDHWHTRGGLVGRGVLIDFEAYARDRGIKFHPFDGTRITVDELEACASYQGVEFRPGDLLFVRTGATDAIEKLQPGEPAGAGAASISGVDGTEETARWIWNKRFCAVASDSNGFEAYPPLKPDGTPGAVDDLGTRNNHSGPKVVADVLQSSTIIS